jgi:hypothetical protein
VPGAPGGIVALNRAPASLADAAQLLVIKAREEKAAALRVSSETHYPMAVLQNYVRYARTINPVLTPEAMAAAVNAYGRLRGDDQVGASRSSYRITVRQLEALIRITESVAKCSLSVDATEAHVDEAIRMFNVSTLSAAQSGMGGGEVLAAHLQEKVKRAEVRILKLVPPGSSMPTSRVKEALARAGYDDSTVNNALKIMERREEVALLNERKTVRRFEPVAKQQRLLALYPHEAAAAHVRVMPPLLDQFLGGVGYGNRIRHRPTASSGGTPARPSPPATHVLRDQR